MSWQSASSLPARRNTPLVIYAQIKAKRNPRGASPATSPSTIKRVLFNQAPGALAATGVSATVGGR